MQREYFQEDSSTNMSLRLLISACFRVTLRLGFACALLQSATACRTAECADGLIVSGARCVPPEGTCESCGAHEFCDTGVDPNACACVAGYGGAPCVFVGLIQDPGFEKAIGEGPWVDQGKGATVIPRGDGEAGSGEGLLDSSVACNAGGLLQRIVAPPYELAEPFKVEVEYTAEGVHGLAIGFNRSWKRLPATGSSWRPETFCLGDGGYGADGAGGPIEVRISASERLANCYEPEPGGRIRINRLTIEPAAEGQCLSPGEVLNGSADAGGDQWDFKPSGGAEAAFAVGEGRDGTDGARIARGALKSGAATMTTQVSVPLPRTLSSPALVFWWRGSKDAAFDVELGTMVNVEDRGRRLDKLMGTESGLNYIYCLPPWTHGTVLDLSFSLPDDNSSAVELVVDDIAITSDSDCGDYADLLDPSFESAPNRWFASVSSPVETVLLESNASLARSGKGLLELRHENANAELSMEAYVWVPSPSVEDGLGPAVVLYSRSPETTSSQVRCVLGLSEVESSAVVQEVTWEPNECCLPPQWANRWFRIQVQMRATEDPLRVERILLDDMSVGTSASCPYE